MELRNILLALAVIAFGLSVSVFNSGVIPHAPATASSTASSSLEAVPNEASGGAAPAAPASPPPPPQATATPPLPASALSSTSSAATTSAPAAPAAPAISDAAISKLDASIGLLQGSLVNIICYSSNGALRSISGTGTVIDSRGVILTAAHIGQYFLLKNYPHKNATECVIRGGSPAENEYTAELAFVSPTWIKENPTTLTDASPKGTGENDFALLVITGSATDSPLPASFKAIPLSTETPAKNEAVSIGSYGAEFLSNTQVKSALYPILDFRTITERYTFDTDTVDLISITGGAAAQEGSSGGAVVNAAHELVGLITTSTTDTQIGTRTLNAITPGHIRRSFEADMHVSLDSYLRNNSLDDMVSAFSDKARTLTRLLTDALP